MEDVIVIGGGPAGSTCGALLSRSGFKVRLFEKEKFPREHVGESLLPFCYWILEDLGVLPELERLFVRKPAVRFLSSDATQATNWCFDHVIDNESYLSFQVDRKYFDTVLLRNAARLGAMVHEQTRVTDVDFDTDPEKVFVTVEDVDGKKETHSARFLIDASGRSSFIATRNKWRVPNPNLHRTAIWTHYFDVAEMKGGLETGSSLIIYLGGEKRGWIWCFPLGPGHCTVGVVLENSYLRDRKREVSANGDRDWRTAILEEELFESPFIKDLLIGARMMDIPFVEGDYSYKSDFKFGDRFAMVGDSGQFIDPIFSSGVFLSMKTATLVSARLERMLKSGNMDHTQLEDVYVTVNGAYDLVKSLIEMYYNPHSITFAEVGEAGDQKEHEAAMAAGHFFLTGDFFENNAKYKPFLELLANPRDFRRYKKTIIDKYDKRTMPCEVQEGMDAFPPGGTMDERFEKSETAAMAAD